MLMRPDLTSMKPSSAHELEARRSSLGCSPVEHAAAGASWNTTLGGGAESQTPVANAERQRRPGDELAALGFAHFPGEGRGEDPSWPAEASFLVLGVGRQEASDLGRKYGQNAIVWVGSDGLPELVLLSLNVPAS